MCGRYSLVDLTNRFTSRFKIANYIGELQARFNVAPEQAMPVVVVLPIVKTACRPE
jgi:putative SOS response-associated peptidase YedK